MYSSKIKEIWEKIHTISCNKDTNLTGDKILKRKNSSLFIPNFEKNKDKFPLSDYYIISDFFKSKFDETSKIFSKFSHQNFFSFIYSSKLSIYNPDSKIFYKEEICTTYNFILNGDIDLYQDDTIINSTLNSGNVYGHLIKDKYNFVAKAKNEVVIVHIMKSTFDKLIIDINEKIKIFKANFIQKFFPKIRTFTGDMLIKILSYFERIKSKKFDIVLNKNKFNDYIYLIISGDVGLCLDFEDILKNNNDVNMNNNDNYIIIEKFTKGDIIGINSALEGNKNKCNCIILSEEAEFYRITKEDLLYFFNKKDLFGDELILNIKSIGDLQNMSINNKITFLKNNSNDNELINKFVINIDKNNLKENSTYEIVYDEPIDNILYQKWRNVKLGLDEMKNKLIGQKKKRIEENKKVNNKDNEGIYKNINNLNKNKNLLDMYKVTNGKLNLKLNNNQIKRLNKFNDVYGIKNDEDINKKNTSKEIELNEEEKEEKK